MLNAFLCLIIGIAILFAGIFFKIIDNGAGIIFALLLTGTRLLMGATAFYVLAIFLFLIIALRFLLKKLVFTAYEKLFNEKYSLDCAISSFGLTFCLMAILTLCIEFFPSASHDLTFCRLAYFASLGAGVAIELSKIANGFAKTGMLVSNSQKTSPLNSGAITVYGAIASFVASFSYGILYYFTDKKTIPSIICVLLSFIAYLIYSFATEKFEYRETTVQIRENESDENSPLIEKTEKKGVEGFSKSVITFISLLIIVAVALIIGYVLK